MDGTINTRSDIAGVLIETGAEALTPAPAETITPAPTVATQPAAPVSGPGSSCGATESFQVTSVDLPVAEGCYQATPASYSTGSNFEAWSVSGTLDAGEVVVIGSVDDGTGEYVSQAFSVVCRSRVSLRYIAWSFIPHKTVNSPCALGDVSVVPGPNTRGFSCPHARLV